MTEGGENLGTSRYQFTNSGTLYKLINIVTFLFKKLFWTPLEIKLDNYSTHSIQFVEEKKA